MAALTLALAPASALAAGAGDDQYQDPLAAPTTPAQQDEKPSTPTPSPSRSAAPAATTQTPAAGASTPAASAQELPRTGIPAGLVALAGASLIGSGLALRRRTVTE